MPIPLVIAILIFAAACSAAITRAVVPQATCPIPAVARELPHSLPSGPIITATPGRNW